MSKASREQEETWQLCRRLSDEEAEEAEEEEQDQHGGATDARRIDEPNGLVGAAASSSLGWPTPRPYQHPPSSSTSRPTKRPRIQEESASWTMAIPTASDAVQAVPVMAARAPASSAPVLPIDASKGVGGEGASLLVDAEDDDDTIIHHPHGFEATATAANVQPVSTSRHDADDFLLLQGRHPALISPEPSTVDLRSYQKRAPSTSAASSSLSARTGCCTATGSSSSNNNKPSSGPTTSSWAEHPLGPTSSSGTMEGRSGRASSTRTTRHIHSSIAFCGVLLVSVLLAVRWSGLSRPPFGAAIMREGGNVAPTMVASSWNDSTSALPATDDVTVNPLDTVYVPGGGFSGFWYTLGRLRSIRNPWHRKEYYCFSAGCLGVVATLLNQSMDDVYAQASYVQAQWQVGSISRYDVVGYFVDSLLSSLDDNGSGDDDTRTDVPSLYDSSHKNSTLERLLPRLRIITSVPSLWGFLVPSIRTPTNRHELRQMLVQTTWIPFATGYGLWHDQHMDGAFTIVQHPPCDYDVGLSLDADLYSNVVNVNLPWSKVEKFWNAGLAHGL